MNFSRQCENLIKITKKLARKTGSHEDNVVCGLIIRSYSGMPGCYLSIRHRIKNQCFWLTPPLSLYSQVYYYGSSYSILQNNLGQSWAGMIYNKFGMGSCHAMSIKSYFGSCSFRPSKRWYALVYMYFQEWDLFL